MRYRSFATSLMVFFRVSLLVRHIGHFSDGILSWRRSRWSLATSLMVFFREEGLDGHWPHLCYRDGILSWRRSRWSLATFMFWGCILQEYLRGNSLAIWMHIARIPPRQLSGQWQLSIDEYLRGNSSFHVNNSLAIGTNTSASLWPLGRIPLHTSIENTSLAIQLFSGQWQLSIENTSATLWPMATLYWEYLCNSLACCNNTCLEEAYLIRVGLGHSSLGLDLGIHHLGWTWAFITWASLGHTYYWEYYFIYPFGSIIFLSCSNSVLTLFVLSTE